MNDLISRQDAMALVDRPIVPTGDAVYDNAREDERASIKDDLSSLPSAKPKTGWIPVSERLPKTGDSVLVTYSDGEVGIVWSARPKAWGAYIENNNLIYPIAWRPLPKPYREYGDKHE